MTAKPLTFPDKPSEKEKKNVLNTCLPNTNTMLDVISDAGRNATVNQHKQIGQT